MGERTGQARGTAVRDRLVDTAAELFYDHGVHAVGIDEVLRRSGLAKATLYRWFPSKNDLILAVLDKRDEAFWHQWDVVAATHADDPRAEIDAHLTWTAALATHAKYRGCPFVNTAAEFDADQSQIRARCLRHERELGSRLRALVARLDLAAGDPHALADLLHLAIVGAFALGGVYSRGDNPARRLRALADQLLGVT